MAIQNGETLAFFPQGGSGRQEAYLDACGFDAAPSSIPEAFLAIQKGETLAFFPQGGAVLDVRKHMYTLVGLTLRPPQYRNHS